MTGEELIFSWRKEAKRRCPHVTFHPHLGLSWSGVQYLRQNPPRLIIGADEVGYGSLAGPVTVCAFAADPDWRFTGLRDSKKLTHAKIIQTAKAIGHQQGINCLYTVCEIDNQRIDSWGLETARQVAFEECIESLREKLGDDFNYSLIVLDGTVTVRHIDHISLPKADDIVPHVSAASVIAKNTRDHWMITQAHKKYPNYGFEDNVGYGTPKHLEALTRFGPSPLHRKSFKVKAAARKKA